jgi:hypothetical protein
MNEPSPTTSGTYLLIGRPLLQVTSTTSLDQPLIGVPIVDYTTFGTTHQVCFLPFSEPQGDDPGDGRDLILVIPVSRGLIFHGGWEVRLPSSLPKSNSWLSVYRRPLCTSGCFEPADRPEEKVIATT